MCTLAANSWCKEQIKAQGGAHAALDALKRHKAPALHKLGMMVYEALK